jgi:hypothetical protein
MMVRASINQGKGFLAPLLNPMYCFPLVMSLRFRIQYHRCGELDILIMTIINHHHLEFRFESRLAYVELFLSV